VTKGRKKGKLYVAELTAKRYFGRQNHSGFRRKLDNPRGDKDLITWVWVHLMVLGMQILGIAKFLVAGVGENTPTASFTAPIFLRVFRSRRC